jgi:hypothetical protein
MDWPKGLFINSFRDFGFKPVRVKEVSYLMIPNSSFVGLPKKVKLPVLGSKAILKSQEKLKLF